MLTTIASYFAAIIVPFIGGRKATDEEMWPTAKDHSVNPLWPREQVKAESYVWWR